MQVSQPDMAGHPLSPKLAGAGPRSRLTLGVERSGEICDQGAGVW